MAGGQLILPSGGRAIGAGGGRVLYNGEPCTCCDVAGPPPGVNCGPCNSPNYPSATLLVTLSGFDASFPGCVTTGQLYDRPNIDGAHELPQIPPVAGQPCLWQAQSANYHLENYAFGEECPDGETTVDRIVPVTISVQYSFPLFKMRIAIADDAIFGGTVEVTVPPEQRDCHSFEVSASLPFTDPYFPFTARVGSVTVTSK